MEILSVSNISFQRNGKSILSDINWTIKPGENWAIVGANGSGKTTLLSIIAGYNWFSDGCVSVLGECFGETSIHELRKKIGWVNSAFGTRLPAHHTALEIVCSGIDATIGFYRDFSESEISEAKKALNALGILNLAERTYGTLSQGEQQRVIIARALINKPVLLILDEPCVGLDPAATENFLDDLDCFVKSSFSPSIIFVTHRIDEIRPFMNRTIVMKEGRIIAAGATEAVLTDKTLGHAFNVNCTVLNHGCRYTMKINKK